VTLRRRVLVYLTLCAVASCVLTVAIAAALVRHKLIEQRLATLESQADVAVLVSGAPGYLRPGAHVYRVSNGRAIRVLSRTSTEVLDELPAHGDSSGRLTVAGRPFIYVSRRTATGLVVFIRSNRLSFAEWRPFLVSLALAGLGGMLLSVVLSALLARRLTAPIRELSIATGRLAGGDSGIAVPVDDQAKDELANLGRAFNAMATELERARTAQRQFLESVSHELKTPLTSVRGYAEALEDDAVPVADAARAITTEADRLQRLVSDLLDLARLGRSDFAVESQPLDLAAIGAAAVRRYVARAQDQRIELSLVGEQGSNSAIGDEGRVLQVISNLVENALRLTPEGGRVVVTARSNEIEVSDSGPGLSTEDLPRAFERFYLHTRYRSQRAVGTGLGLAIVEELVSAMSGEVTVENREGGGARFTVKLPTQSFDHREGFL
jgi:signal transduction histidine kinase